MKTGIIVEGVSEYRSLPELRERLLDLTAATGLKVLRATYNPYAPPKRIVRACSDRVKQLAGRDYALALVLIDREDQPTPAASIASSLESAFAAAGLPIPVRVVVKDRAFENWLVADLDAVHAQPARFHLPQSVRQRVEPDKADHIDALKLLRQASQGDAYGKVDDAKRILALADPAKAAQHSRSFRCFLGRLGHPSYSSGSCKP